MCHKNSQKGTTAIFFAVIVTAIILGIAFGMSTLLLGGLSIQQGSGLSTIAYYAAEAGVEHIFFEDKNCHGDAGCLQNAVATTWGPGGVVSLSNGTTYTVDVEDAADCTGPSFCATSIGTFGNVVRTIDVTRRIFLLPCAEEIDVALALDLSGSIDEFDLANLKTAANNFIDLLFPFGSDTEAGIVTFQNLANTVQAMTSVESDLHTAIDSLGSGVPLTGSGGTNLQDGIQQAFQVELTVNDRSDATAPDYMIVVSDGDPTNYFNPNVDCFPEHDHAEGPGEPDPSYKACKQAARDEALAEAVAAKGNGITIFVLGVDVVGSLHGGTTAADSEDLLRSIASSPAHYASVSDYSDLEDALTNLCGG